MNKEEASHFSRKHIHDKNIEEHLKEIHKEFKDGFEFLQKYPKSVTIYGSARTKVGSEEWKKAEELGRRIVKDLKYTVLTGGGPGIMAAAHEGAKKAGGQAVGLRITLPKEQTDNPYMTDSMLFAYFFARKTMLNFAAEAYIFFPGGFGTFDELFSTLTLIQTRKIPSVPVILFGSTFWNELLGYIKKQMLDKEGAIDPYDINIFEITDDIDRVIEVIRTAPVSEWWRVIS